MGWREWCPSGHWERERSFSALAMDEEIGGRGVREVMGKEEGEMEGKRGRGETGEDLKREREKERTEPVKITRKVEGNWEGNQQ